MDWTAQFDAYCERVDLTFWSEPVNAVTNLAFLIAAIIMWRRTVGVPGARLLCAILFLTGIGSALFHTFATGWAAMLDTTPILAYILTYIYLVHRDILGLPRLWSAAAVVMFVPFAAIVVFALRQVPFFQVSTFYWTVPVLLIAYGWALRRSRPSVARGFVIGAAILSLSITMRTLDEMLCHVFPMGTHFGWHILNAMMLGYMIHVYAVHGLGKGGPDR